MSYKSSLKIQYHIWYNAACIRRKILLLAEEYNVRKLLVPKVELCNIEQYITKTCVLLTNLHILSGGR